MRLEAMPLTAHLNLLLSPLYLHHVEEFVMLCSALERRLLEWHIDVCFSGRLARRHIHHPLALHQEIVVELALGHQEVVFQSLEVVRELRLHHN